MRENNYREYFNERFENPVRDRHDRDSVFNQQAIVERRQLANQRFISSDQIEQFLGLFRITTESGSVDKIYFYLALIQLRTGLRIGEACALKWDDIGWDTGLITVNKTVQWMRRASRRSQVRDSTKTGRSRPLWLIPELRSELRELQISQGRIRGLIFSANGIELLKYRSIQYAYGKVFEKTQLPFRSTHILRHSFATSFAEKTQNMMALEGILGHSDPRMTRKYAKITEDSIINGMEAFARSLKTKNLRRPETGLWARSRDI